MQRGRLTDRQADIYRFVLDYFGKNLKMPTYREIGERFAISSANGVAANLKAIAKKGWFVIVLYESRMYFRIPCARLVGFDEAGNVVFDSKADASDGVDSIPGIEQPGGSNGQEI